MANEVLTYEYSAALGGYQVTGYTSIGDGKITIPSKYNDDTNGEKPVVAIKEKAFDSCSSLESVTIGNSVTSIGLRAFYKCSSLTSVTIPDSVKSISSSVFASCTSLMSVTIGNSVESIGSYAFANCDSLVSVTIPRSVTSIGPYVFEGCSSLASVTIPDSVTSIGDSAFSSCDNLESVTIGNNITSIGDSAFYNCSSLTSVTIPDSVESIGDSAFYNCTSLASVTIGSGVRSIGVRTFYNCDSLASVNIKDVAKWCAIKFGDSYSNPLCYANKLYLNGELITDLIIPEGVTIIPNYAFSCNNITSVTIQNSVTSIGDSAFEDCSSLESVTIPDSVTSIGSYAFRDCDKLTIYCEVEDKPDGWSDSWNYSNRPVVWDYRINTTDLDFLAFTYNGKHSMHDMNVWRVIDGDRYNSDLHPSLTDKTAEVPGGDGTYYFGSYHKQKDIPVSFAFDHMTEVQFREWKKLCNGKEVADLIFDEEPYKVYSAKPSGTSSIKYICFDEIQPNGTKQRIYKGEGSITFTCYYPYAHTPDENTKICTKIKPSGLFFGDGRYLDFYPSICYSNKSLWQEASGLSSLGSSTSSVPNPGDIPAPFVLTKTGSIGLDNNAQVTFTVGECSITVPAISATTNEETNITSYTHYRDLTWNSKTGMVTAKASEAGPVIAIPYTGTSIGTIPVGGLAENKVSLNGGALKYHYWYY